MSDMKLLSLDDDEKFTNLLQAKLKNRLVELTCVGSVQEFLNLFTSQDWDCCLLDVNLSEGSEAGFVLLRLIREKLNNNTCIIFLSRSNENEKIAHALECGANDYINKPLDVDFLMAKIQSLLSTQSELEKTIGMQKVPQAFRESEVSTMFSPETIDEEGITLVGPNCISKGTNIDLEGELIQEIFQEEKINLMVTKNTKINKEQYSIFLEFGESDNDLVVKAKNWIISKN